MLESLLRKMKNNLSFIIIIANYNGEKYLSRCLESIKNLDYKNFKVCVVDDGSIDTSMEILESFKNQFDLEIICQNHGGASKARNNAIKRFKNNFDVLLFLDNDTEIDKYCLNEINKQFISSQEIDSVQCLLIDFENRDVIQSNGMFLIPHVCWGVSYQGGAYLRNLNKKSIPCAAISAALAVRSYVFDKVGYFDEKLAVSTEDLDFTWRMWVLGFKIFNSPDAVVYHFSKGIAQRKEMNVNLESQYFHITKNSFRTLIKNYSLKSLFWFLPQCFLINFLRAVLVLIKRRDTSSLKSFFKAIYWNLTNLNETLKIRKKIQKSRVKSDKSIYNTVMIKDSLLDIYEKYFKQTKLL